jgi:purine-binding chemotaxis protein CheW
VATTQLCTFSVDGLLLGVDVLRVQEVIRFQQLTRVPLAPPVVRGLINLRGQIVTAIDLRRRLGLPPRAVDHKPMNVIIRSDDGAVSLLVDEIGDVLELDPRDFDRPPETVPRVVCDLIQGIYKMPGGLLLVLDTEKVVAPSGSMASIS